jgi:hypothetical protein
MPVKTGIQVLIGGGFEDWIPAYAGMTEWENGDDSLRM